MKKAIIIIVAEIAGVVIAFFLFTEWLPEHSIMFLEAKNITILSIFLAIEILCLSMWITLRANFINDSRMADANFYSYRLQAGISLGQEQNTYQEIAREWYEVSEDCIRSARIRTYSAGFSMLSLISLVITFIPFLLSHFLFSTATFAVFLFSMALLIYAVIIQAFSLDYPCLKKIMCRLRGIFRIFPEPVLQRRPEIQRMIDRTIKSRRYTGKPKVGENRKRGT